MMRLDGKIGLVTGGGSGIGRAICELFAREGAVVIPVDLLENRARETAELVTAAGGVATPIAADVSRRESVEQMAAEALEAHGRVDILVNNAGFNSGDDILELDEEAWDLDLRVVLKSVYLCCRALLPQMIEHRYGSIVNMSSVNGLMGLSSEAYSAAKAGVINLTQNLAVRYGRHGVRVNTICPGTVRTPIWRNVLEKDPEVFERLTKWYPLGRVGEPEDIARPALFLASDDAAWITGQILVVDGGLTAGIYAMSMELTAKSEG